MSFIARLKERAGQPLGEKEEVASAISSTPSEELAERGATSILKESVLGRWMAFSPNTLPKEGKIVRLEEPSNKKYKLYVNYRYYAYLEDGTFFKIEGKDPIEHKSFRFKMLDDSKNPVMEVSL